MSNVDNRVLVIFSKVIFRLNIKISRYLELEYRKYM